MVEKSVQHIDGDERSSTDIMINVLLDRSGSMSGKETDVIGNFNAYYCNS